MKITPETRFINPERHPDFLAIPELDCLRIGESIFSYITIRARPLRRTEPIDENGPFLTGEFSSLHNYAIRINSQRAYHQLYRFLQEASSHHQTIKLTHLFIAPEVEKLSTLPTLLSRLPTLKKLHLDSNLTFSILTLLEKSHLSELHITDRLFINDLERAEISGRKDLTKPYIYFEENQFSFSAYPYLYYTIAINLLALLALTTISQWMLAHKAQDLPLASDNQCAIPSQTYLEDLSYSALLFCLTLLLKYVAASAVEIDKCEALISPHPPGPKRGE